MKQNLNIGLSALILLAGSNQVSAQGAQFFRIAGPVPTTITALTASGYVTWTNVPTNATFTVRVVKSLSGHSNWVDYIQVPGTNAVTTQRIYDPSPPSGMALIPAGSFTMGDTLDGVSDAIPTNVYVSAFYMDTRPVSYSQWQTVYNWATSHGYGFDNPGSGKAANHPVQSVNWYDTVKWCNARSQQAGLTAVYYTDAGLTRLYMNGDTNAVYVNWSAQGYRLPTEAEWEKAARGGLSGQRFPWGDTISESQANYVGSIGGYDLGPNGYNANYDGTWPYTSPVGSFAPNGYGLYDMAGNVQEWCWDWYGTPYAAGSNPHGPTSGSIRLLRGGSWNSLAGGVRTAVRARDVYGLTDSSPAIGFRSVIPSGQ